MRKHILLPVLLVLLLLFIAACDEEDEEGQTLAGSGQSPTQVEPTLSPQSYQVRGIIEVDRVGVQSTGAAPVPWTAGGVIRWDAWVDPQSARRAAFGYHVNGAGQGEVTYDAPVTSPCSYNRGRWPVNYSARGFLLPSCNLEIEITESWNSGMGEAECSPVGRQVSSLAPYSIKFEKLSFPDEGHNWTITTELSDGGVMWTNVFTVINANGTDVDRSYCGWFPHLEDR